MPAPVSLYIYVYIYIYDQRVHARQMGDLCTHPWSIVDRMLAYYSAIMLNAHAHDGRHNKVIVNIGLQWGLTSFVSPVFSHIYLTWSRNAAHLSQCNRESWLDTSWSWRPQPSTCLCCRLTVWELKSTTNQQHGLSDTSSDQLGHVMVWLFPTGADWLFSYTPTPHHTADNC